MATYNLHVRDADNQVVDWNRGGPLGSTPEGQTFYPSVTLGFDPVVGDTYDGVTYTPAPKPSYLVIQDGADLAKGAIVSINPGQTKILTVQRRDGNGLDEAGTDTVLFRPVGGLLTLDKSEDSLDSMTGSCTVTIGPEDKCGEVMMWFRCASLDFNTYVRIECVAP